MPFINELRIPLDRFSLKIKDAPRLHLPNKSKVEEFLK
jgi:hypothetical protein